MKAKHILSAVLGLLILACQNPLQAADTSEEQQLIQTLQSDRSLAEKDAACARLKRIGTVQALPTLTRLLDDEQLSHSARYALESMPAPEAGKALLEALVFRLKFDAPGQRTLTKVGLINSLGFRRETGAVATLSRVLADSDSAMAIAAATALGNIGGPEALQALLSAGGAPGNATANRARDPRVHDAVADGLLRCAQRLLSAGDQAKALPIFEALYKPEEKEHVRVAAYRGMILSSGSRALPLMVEAIADQPGPRQTAALQLVRDIDVPSATEALAQLLPKLTPPVQTALVEGLGQRHDAAAAAASAPLTRSSTPEVRLAAINALGLLGAAESVSVLAEAAAAANGAEQEAARVALVRMPAGASSQTLLDLLPTAQPAVQAELARALGDRGETAAMPKLLELAQQVPESTRKGVLDALALLAGQPQLDAIVALALSAKTDTGRTQAAEALRAAFQRLQGKNGRADAKPLVRGMATASPEARIALLPICSGLADPQIRMLLRIAVQDRNPQVHAAAVRSLCDTSDAELFPEVVKAACELPEENLRTLAIGGCVRMATREDNIKLPNAQRVEAFKAILATRLSTDQKRLILGGLAEIPDEQALRAAEPLLEDSTVQNEAALAIVKIAPTLPQSSPAIAALKKVLEATQDAATRQAAQTTLKGIETRADYLTTWQMAGPYRQAGKNYAVLFDIVFPPEAAVSGSGTAAPQAGGVNWQPLPPSTNPARPWSMDLLRALGGQQCVAYARTYVYSEQEQAARLELGSDDGVKVWLNGKQVHANNATRALRPGSDKVNVTLKAGWNGFLLKVTQNNQGWEFCARLLKPDGSHIDGLRCDANAKP